MEIPGQLSVEINTKGIVSKFGVTVGEYENVGLFSGPSLSVGVGKGPWGFSESFSVQPDGYSKYSGYSASVGVGSRASAGISYTFLYDLRRK